jgi:hypothetical protein
MAQALKTATAHPAAIRDLGFKVIASAQAVLSLTD